MGSAEPGIGCNSSISASCQRCRLNHLCLPLALEHQDIVRLDDIVERKQPLRKDQLVYRQGAPFQSIYAVRTGAVKACFLDRDGEETVIGFYLPGEVFGIDGIGTRHYRSTASALEHSAICEIPFDRFDSLGVQLPGLRQHLLALLSRDLVEEQQHSVLLAKRSAEQRVAAFLINLSHRYKRQQLSSTDFQLPLSRTEIASYLGLTIETVSRVFSRFSKQGLLALNQRELRNCQIEKLQPIALAQSA